MANKYRGKCNGCGSTVDAGSGTVERRGRVWVVWCHECYNKSDNSGYEDRCCGDRAYEDQCARDCGYDY